jgi:hypothetical protein
LGGAGRADIETLSLSADGLSLQAKGSIKDFSAPDADVNLAIKKFEFRALAPLVDLPPEARDASLDGDLHLKGGAAAAALSGTLKAAAPGLSTGVGLDLSVKDPAGSPSLDGAISLADLKVDRSALAPGLRLSGPSRMEAKLHGGPDHMAVSLTFSADGADAAYKDLFLKPAGTALGLKAEAALSNKKDLAIRACRLTLAGASVNLSGSVVDAPGAGRLDLVVKADPFDVSPFGKLLPAAAELKPAGRLGLDASVNGTAAAPRARGTILLEGLGATPTAGISVAGLTGRAAFTDDSLEAPDLKGKFNGEALALKASVRHFARPEVSLEGSLAALDLGKLQTVFASTATAGGAAAPAKPAAGPAPLAKARGSFKIGAVSHPYYLGKNFAFAWDLSDVGPALSLLSGTAQIAAADGRIRNLPLADKINALTKKSSGDLTYSRIGGHMTIARGVLNTQDFLVDSDQADISAKGTVNLDDKVADLKAVFKLAKGAVGGSTGEWFAGEDGRVTLEASITGPLTDPVIRPDLSKAAARAAKSLLQKQLQKALGGGGDQPANDGAPSSQQKLEEQGQKLLRNLFKKKS